MLLKKSFRFLILLVLVQGDPVAEESKRCYQCSQCPMGCTGMPTLVSKLNVDENDPEKNKSKDDEASDMLLPLFKCCAGSEPILPVCEECDDCPDTGCNKVTGECCSGPEDVPGGCVPCPECDQCAEDSKMCCPATKDCPMKKTVGDTDYTLSYTGQVASGCLHNCVYHKDNDTTSKFCFKTGSQSVSYENGRNKLAINHTVGPKNRGWATWRRFSGYWGDWGYADYCPSGSFVYGYTIQSERGNGWGFDDTAMNSISMKCRRPGSSSVTKHLYSRRGSWGKWSDNYEYCYKTTNPVVGFDVLFESRRLGFLGISDDDTTVNDIDLYCSNDQMLSASRRSNWGTWTEKYMCPSGMAVMGIQTRVEGSQGGGDDTSFNGLIIYCASYP